MAVCITEVSLIRRVVIERFHCKHIVLYTCSPATNSPHFLYSYTGRQRSGTSITSGEQESAIFPEIEDLHQKIHKDVKMMKHKFSTLQTKIRKNIKENVSHEELASHVVGMYILSDDHEKQVKKASSIEEIFNILTKYWSFLDFSILENIAVNLCESFNAEEEIRLYRAEVVQFCERRVSEFPQGSLSHGTDSEGMGKLVVKLDLQDPSLKHVKHLKEVIADILEQPASKLVLHDIEYGSVLVTFLIATSLGDKLLIKRTLTEEQEDALREAHVTSLEFKGISVFSSHPRVKKRKLGIVYIYAFLHLDVVAL